MSQTTVSLIPSGNRAAAPVPAIRLIHWVFIAVGMIAPLLLVAGAGLFSGDALERTQIIVQGSERLALLLIGAVLVSVLYHLGVREAQIVAGEPEALTAY